MVVGEEFEKNLEGMEPVVFPVEQEDGDAIAASNAAIANGDRLPAVLDGTPSPPPPPSLLLPPPYSQDIDDDVLPPLLPPGSDDNYDDDDETPPPRVPRVSYRGNRGARATRYDEISRW